MMDLLKKVFGGAESTDSHGKEPTRNHDIRVAACALFLEMAHIDGEFSEEEKHRIISIMKSKYNLSDDYVAALMVAAGDELNRSLDYWQFTNLINQHYTDEEKMEIIEMAWQIVYIDGKLDKNEDYLMHKFSKLLRIPHRKFIEAKLKAKRRSS